MKNKKSIFFTFLASLLFCKLVYWLFTFANPDEAYYWLWGRYPALSYHEHPALQSIMQAVFYKLFGNSLFALRLPVMLSFLADILILHRLLKRLNRATDLKWVILTFFSIPLFFMFTSFAWNDYMMITMSLASGYFWLNYLTDRWNQESGSASDILLAFLFLGLAALSKYNSVFMAFAIPSLIILNKPLRTVSVLYRYFALYIHYLANNNLEHSTSI